MYYLQTITSDIIYRQALIYLNIHVEEHIQILQYKFHLYREMEFIATDKICLFHTSNHIHVFYFTHLVPRTWESGPESLWFRYEHFPPLCN